MTKFNNSEYYSQAPPVFSVAVADLGFVEGGSVIFLRTKRAQNLEATPTFG